MHPLYIALAPKGRNLYDAAPFDHHAPQHYDWTMHIDHAVLAVSDLAASLPWYEVLLPLLGFTKTRPHVWVNAQDFAVDVQQAKDPAHVYKREGVGLNHLAVRAESRAEVDEVARTMKAAGFDVPAAQELGDTYALFLKDRDGMRIEVSGESKKLSGPSML